MLVYVEPPNEKITITNKILKTLCVFTLVIGLFKISSQGITTSSGLYCFSGVLYVLSWRGLSYYYCLFNQIINVSMIIVLLQEVHYNRYRWLSYCKMVYIRHIFHQVVFIRWDVWYFQSFLSILISLLIVYLNN